MLNTYVFNHTENLSIFTTQCVEAGKKYMLSGPYALLDEYEGKVKIKDYLIEAINECDVKYTLLMKAINEDRAKEYWKMLYPNDVFVKIDVDRRKGIMY